MDNVISRDKLTENTQVLDIVCPRCKGMLQDLAKSTEKWTSAPINLYCPKCDIEWLV